MGRLIEGVWDCPYCDSKRIRGSIRECPVCGRQRDHDITFYMADPKNYVNEEEAKNISRNPDWLCSYCDGLNADNVNECHYCGASRDGSERNYFENKADIEARRNNSQKVSDIRKRYTDSDFLYIDGKFLLKTPETQKQYDAIDRTPEYERQAEKESTDKYSNHIYDSFGGNSTKTRKQEHDDRMPHINNEDSAGEKLIKSLFQREKSKSRLNLGKILKIGAGVLATIMLIMCMVWIFTPKVQEVTIQDFSWERSINVQKLVTVDKSGWSLPPDGRLQYQQQEIQGYEQVLDHYETKTEEYYESEFVGYDESVSYVDLGNGYFEEVVTKIPKYEQVKKTREIQVPIYRDEPIYAIKYYYEIDEWQHDYSSKSSGNDKSPYWKEVELKEKQRESGRSETYYITVVNDKGESNKYSFDFNVWDRLESGQKVTIKTTVFGTAELVLDEVTVSANVG